MPTNTSANTGADSVERLVPVPRVSADGFAVFSEIRTSRQHPLALCDAVRAGRIPASDLPEIIANIWTRDDSPTSDLAEADWLEIFRATAFFSYPPLVVRQPDGTRLPLARPSSAVTLYRGSLADRVRRMSWTSERELAEQLGRRHTPYGPAVLYKATVEPCAILAYLERRGEGWTVVVDPCGAREHRAPRGHSRSSVRANIAPAQASQNRDSVGDLPVGALTQNGRRPWEHGRREDRPR